MLYYNRIDLNEEIDPAKSNSIKKYIACHYWFCNHGFNFQNSVCDGCVQILVLLLLLLLKVLVVAVLFKALAILVQFIC